MNDTSKSQTRLVTDHHCNRLNEAIEIEAGEPGVGGAPTFYKLTMIPPASRGPAFRMIPLQFQSKPIKTPEDFDGLTNEALLAVIIDRMRGFQSGPFACRENAIALTKLQEALMWLHQRTRQRIDRGVEGTLKP